jgi:hypothetical protein
VTAVEVLHDSVVGVTFDDGTVGEVDLLPKLWGPVFEPLRADATLFAQVQVDAERKVPESVAVFSADDVRRGRPLRPARQYGARSRSAAQFGI